MILTIKYYDSKYTWFMNGSVHFDRNETEYYLRVGVPLFVPVMYVHGGRNM